MRESWRQGEILLDTHTDESDGSPPSQGLKDRLRPALVGGENIYPPVNVWCHTGLFPGVVPDGGGGWGAGRSSRRTGSWLPLAFRSQITTVRWSPCEAISFPKTKRLAKLQKSCSLDRTHKPGKN